MLLPIGFCNSWIIFKGHTYNICITESRVKIHGVAWQALNVASVRTHSERVGWANTKRKAISSRTQDHLPTKQATTVGWANYVVRTHSERVGWANTKRKAISSRTQDHLPTKQDPRLAVATTVGWANYVGLAISSKCHVHLPTKQDQRLAVGHATG
ncbi:MAG: hypothetical protein F6K37_19175 [Moorea sp. SIO4E2]|uniref:hypothetical protein n=1 Tax=Moorena sp. SIO4E2 TaxID=2607826 RepID=UPI0013B5E876|nr:hypothetical protein [Moorena sp. SIO4E2]NEQ07991.1 hypothetical protein [Moorena sp. SIO4E2]